MFEFITRRITRKAVDWHHSALDEIITGAICAAWSRKGGVAQYKTRGSWKSKKKKGGSREKISSDHLPSTRIFSAYVRHEIAKRTTKRSNFTARCFIGISLDRVNRGEDRVTNSKQTSAAVSFMGQSRVRFNFNSPRVISWAPACLFINLNYGAIKSS